MTFQNINSIFFDMGNTLLDFHTGMSDTEKDLLGLEKMSQYIFEQSKVLITPEILKTEFFQPWEDFITPNRKLHLKEYPVEQFLQPLLDKYKVNLSQTQIIEALDQQHFYFRQYLTMDEKLPNILNELKNKGFKLGVISNCYTCTEVYIKHFEHMDIKKYFSSFSFSYEVIHRKPKIEIFQHALKSLNSKATESVMIGDSLNADIAGAQNIGMKTIWYNKKNKINDTQIRPDLEIKEFSEILNYF